MQQNCCPDVPSTNTNQYESTNRSLIRLNPFYFCIVKFLSLFTCLLAPVVAFSQQDTTAVDTNRVYRSLEAALQQPENVYRLDLSKKKLASVPPEITRLVNLRELDLSRNKIREVPAELGQMKNLQKLNLASNKIKQLPPEIGSLTNLVYLGLNRNLIESLPSSIGSLKMLQTLELWDNELDSIPDEIGQLKNLKVLELRGILFSEEEQQRIQSLLPETTIYFSPSCHCKF